MVWIRYEPVIVNFCNSEFLLYRTLKGMTFAFGNTWWICTVTKWTLNIATLISWTVFANLFNCTHASCCFCVPCYYNVNYCWHKVVIVVTADFGSPELYWSQELLLLWLSLIVNYSNSELLILKLFLLLLLIIVNTYYCELLVWSHYIIITD